MLAFLLTVIMLGACDDSADDAEGAPTPTDTAAGSPTAAPPETTPTPERSPTSQVSTNSGATEFSYHIVATYPHDPAAFTQGLEYHDGYLYESTGRYGESSLRKVELESGEVLHVHELEESYFGEGMTILNDRIYQLTWRENAAFVYDLETFDRVEEFSYQTEGWGLTNDGERLIMTDGSNVVYFRDPASFEETGRIEVRDESGPVARLNELEWIDGEIWANVWQEDVIVVIDPESGEVTRRIDLTGVLQPEDQGDREVDVLNGIAYDAENDRLFVTGKLWPALYEIEVVPHDQGIGRLVDRSPIRVSNRLSVPARTSRPRARRTVFDPRDCICSP